MPRGHAESHSVLPAAVSPAAGGGGRRGGGGSDADGRGGGSPRLFDQRAAAKNRVYHEALKAELRQNMQRPAVANSDLKKIVDRLYRTDAEVGSGSTADAIRYETLTGQKVKGSYHTQKGRELLLKLQKWIEKNPTASGRDRAAAENILMDLKDALGIVPRVKPTKFQR